MILLRVIHIGGALLPYLMSGDTAGITTEAKEKADQFIRTIPGRFAIRADIGGDVTRCDITGEFVKPCRVSIYVDIDTAKRAATTGRAA